jgi:hypothetical protein
MKFETTDDHSAVLQHAHHPMSTTGPYEKRWQARTDVADVYTRCDPSYCRGVLGEANLAYLRNACAQDGVTVGAFDARILAWLAGWEPETCAVIAGLITRAGAVALSDRMTIRQEDLSSAALPRRPDRP